MPISCVPVPQAQDAASKKVEKLKDDLDSRLDSLRKQQDVMQRKAEVLETNMQVRQSPLWRPPLPGSLHILYSQAVDDAIGVVRSALESGMDW